MKDDRDIENESRKLIRKYFPNLFLKQEMYSKKKVFNVHMDRKNFAIFHDLMYSMSYLSLSLMVYK